MTMENMNELHDQQITDSSSVTPSTTHGDLISPHSDELSPTISRPSAIAVSVASMIDSSEFRSQMPEPTYQTLNGRMSPGGFNTQSSYATLTPLQPLPPISTMSTVSDKFGLGATPNVSGSFTLMQNNGHGIDMKYRYDNLGSMGMNMNISNINPMSSMMGGMTSMNTTNDYVQPQSLGSYTGYNQNGIDIPSSIKIEHKPIISPNSYDSYTRGLGGVPVSRIHSPNPVMPTTLNGIHQTHTPSPHHTHSVVAVRERIPSASDSPGSKHEVEEINTKELAQKISSELKRYSIPQAVFAQRVLCRSQGTLSDLLRNPKPWSKLKSGRETFRRMWKWLQEPEFQRMSALRLAGKLMIFHQKQICFKKYFISIIIVSFDCLYYILLSHLIFMPFHS